MLSLVTGSSGLLGHCLVSRLWERGDRVRMLDLVPPDCEEVQSGSEFVCGDCAEESQLEKAARGVDVIFHLAAAQRMKPQFARLSEDQVFQGNLAGVRNVLRVAERCGVRKVVVLSSSGIYGLPQRVPCGEDHPTRPLGSYGRSKLDAEDLCRDAMARGLDVTVLRPMSLFGPRMTGIFVMLFEWVRTGKPVFILGRGRNRVQMVSAWDVVDACLLSVDRPEASGAFLNLGSEPDSVPSVYEEVRALVAHAGTGSPILRIPAFALRTTARLLQPFGLSPIVPEHYLLADRDFILDIDSARRVLGWRPRHDNVRMLIDAYDWYAAADESYRFRPPFVLRILNAVTPRGAASE
jgi:nucleoside-diphosphate-sugar epimerase